ncbi:hypothetical protein BKA70DRAFT_1514026 [Coprinopsis sp. MPI-PUGE-AT-0042]|nr:hypothetical protein BKA70DRAFT_1514026 [Coprinopsis sp. MPI-PUGE-AT-0042]
MSEKPTSSTRPSLLPRSMSLKRRKTEKKATGAAGASRAGTSAQGQGNGRRRNSDSVTGHSAPLETFKLPSWLVPPSVYKSKHSSSNRKGPHILNVPERSSSRRKKLDSALTDSEGTVTSITSSLRSTRSMRNLFTRPSTSTLSSTRTRTRPHQQPFSPSLPPEIWVLIFQHATSPPNPFLASSAVSSHPYSSSSTSTSSHSFLHFPHTQGHLLKEYRKSMRTKCDLTLVCKLWWAIGQEVLFEFVWLTKAREASLLAALLSDVSIRSADVSVGVGSVEVEPATKSKVLGRVMMGKGKEKERVAGFEGISVSTTTSVSYSTPPPPSLSSHTHSRSPSTSTCSTATPTTGTYTFPYDTRAIGRHIRRLHIETHSLDRCSPQDLLTILTHAPALQVFSDNQSIRRTSGFCVLSSSSSGWNGSMGGSMTTVISSGSSSSSIVGGGGSARTSLGSSSPSGSTVTITAGDNTNNTVFDSSSSGRTRADSGGSTSYFAAPQHQQDSDMQLLSALISPQRRTTSLRRLSWTSYEYEAGDFEAGAFLSWFFSYSVDANAIVIGMTFYTRIIGPKLRMVSAHLEYLELTLCAKDLMRGVTGQGGTGGGFFESLIGAGNFTSSTITTTTTTTVTSSSSSSSQDKEKSLSHSLSTETLRSIQSAVGALDLPNLTSLKLTLDNVTCLVVSTWDLPAIRHVSLIASDFSYANEGFASFFDVHGGKIEELELGHSTGAIEEFWLTAPPHPTAASSNDTSNGWRFGSTRVPLAEWCPNLKTFICSADAEWNWENPDWIAPHVLLPAHPTVEVIGVRDIEKRIHEALGRAEYRDRVAISEGRGFAGLDGAGGEGVNDPFFALLEQLGSLVKSEAFPALKYVRDLSPQSRVMRETGRVKVRDVEMRSMGSFAGRWWDDDDDDESDSEEEEEPTGRTTATTATASTTPTAYGHARGNSAFGQGGFVALWTAMVQNMSSPTSTSNSSSASPSAPSASLNSNTSKPTGKTLQKLLEHQQGIRVLRFWKNVLALFSGRGVYLEDCDGYNVTLARLRRAAALETGKA